MPTPVDDLRVDALTFADDGRIPNNPALPLLLYHGALAPDAIAAEATPGIETTLVTDLDLDMIKELRALGSVRNVESRRTDLYDLRWLDRS